MDKQSLTIQETQFGNFSVGNFWQHEEYRKTNNDRNLLGIYGSESEAQKAIDAHNQSQKYFNRALDHSTRNLDLHP